MSDVVERSSHGDIRSYLMTKASGTSLLLAFIVGLSCKSYFFAVPSYRGGTVAPPWHRWAWGVLVIVNVCLVAFWVFGYITLLPSMKDCYDSFQPAWRDGHGRGFS